MKELSYEFLDCSSELVYGKYDFFSNYLIPTRIESLVGKVVTDIASGSAHSAAIVNQTELYTWGLGDYGRLGHGDEVTQLEPKKVGINLDLICY